MPSINFEIGQGSRPCGATLSKSGNFWYFGSRIRTPLWRLRWNFAQPSGTHVPDGPAKFDMNRCNESPLRGEKPDFWPVSKNNTGSLPLRGNPAGNKRHKFRHYKPVIF